MIERIWITDWELQCCSDAFIVGDEVRWPLSPADDEEWITEMLGPGPASVDAVYDHHTGDDAREVPARVVGIEAVFCTHEQPGRTRSPVAGSATREDRMTATGWEPEPGPARFVGCLVEVERA